MAKPDHVIVKEVDSAYSAEFPHFKPEYTYSIECLTEGGCGGYTECFEDHTEGVYGGDDVQIIHGQVHTLVNDAWTVPYKGCPVQHAYWEVPERIEWDATPPGRYPVLAEWDDYQVTLEEQGNG